LLKPVFYQYLKRGANWISMPRPSLGRGSLDPGYYTEKDIDLGDVLADPIADSVEGVGYELLLDGAQCMRLGLHVPDPAGLRGEPQQGLQHGKGHQLRIAELRRYPNRGP
jgi:hypothetical protein